MDEGMKEPTLLPCLEDLATILKWWIGRKFLSF